MSGPTVRLPPRKGSGRTNLGEVSDCTVIVLVCWGRRNKVPQTGWLKQQNYFSYFWRPEVQDQSTGRAGFL